MTRDGLYFTDPARDDANPEWVCQEFSVLGECENGMGGDWGVVLSWQDAAEHRHTWIVPCEMFHGEPHAISAHLHSHGLRCSYTKTAQAQSAALSGIGATRTPLAGRHHRRLAWHVLHSAGWHRVWRCRHHPAPRTATRRSVVRPSWHACRNGRIRWRDTQSATRALALFLSAAFAGALLEFIAEPSGGLHLYGKSQTGKSTAAFVAASVLGKGARDGNAHQWRATGNGLEGLASRCSDGCLVMDEISQSDAREADNFDLSTRQRPRQATRGSVRRRTATRKLAHHVPQSRAKSPWRNACPTPASER